MNKVMNMTDAIKTYVRDNALISFGGFSATQCPMAAVHEIIRQGIKDLHVAACSNGQAVDELVGAGCVKSLEIAYGGNGRFAPTCFKIREKGEKGELKIEDYSNLQMSMRFLAGSLGIPFIPTYSTLGTDIMNKQMFSKEERKTNKNLSNEKFVVMQNPFNEDLEDKVVLVPAIQPDVTIIHAQKADPCGNTRIEGLVYADIEQAKASKALIVTCEELVDSALLRDDPAGNQIVSFQVNAVVHVPYGAYPCAVINYYDYDPWFLMQLYKTAAKDETEWKKYMDKYILGVKNREEFLALIGRERLETVKADKKYGFNPKLNRR